jgi:hypothetical protein
MLGGPSQIVAKLSPSDLALSVAAPLDLGAVPEPPLSDWTTLGATADMSPAWCRRRAGEPGIRG